MCTKGGSKIVERDNDKFIDSRCIVEFRPDDDWDGEYGFDWYRIGDYGEKTNESRSVFLNYDKEGTVGKYYVSNEFDKKRENYVSYREKYHADPDPDCLDFNVSFNANEKYSNLLKNDYTKIAINGCDRDYLIPWMSLCYKKNDNKSIKKMATNSSAMINIVIKRDSTNISQINKICIVAYGNYIRFGTNNKQILQNGRIISNYIEFTAPFISDSEKRIKLPIEIINPLPKNLNIKALAFYTGEDDKEHHTLAGLLHVSKNDLQQIDVCFVNIICIRYNTVPSPALSPDDINFHKNNLIKYLSQAQIFPNITYETMVISDSNGSEYQSNIRNGKKYIVDGKNGFSHQYESKNLIVKLEEDFNNKHKELENHYKVFFLDGVIYNRNDEPKGGKAGGIPSKSAIIAQNPADSTICHELLHCLGLYHSFSNNNYYTYRQYSTTNIMDYPKGNHDMKRNCLWHWQWQRIKKNIKKK